MARPTKLTPAVREQLISHVRAGIPPRIAASALGLTTKTLDNWLDRGRVETKGVYHAFAIAVDEALAKSAIPLIATVRRAARTSVKAAVWLLERSYPVEFERKRLPEALEPGFSAAEKASEIRATLRAMQASVAGPPPVQRAAAAG